MDLSLPRRRILSTLLAGPGLRLGAFAAAASDKAKRRRKRKKTKQDRCQSGPCTYDLFLLYVDAIYAWLPDTEITRATRKAADGFCGEYALTKTGKAYRDAVVACIDQYV